MEAIKLNKNRAPTEHGRCYLSKLYDNGKERLLLNKNGIEQKQTFLGSIKEKLMRERELLERKIKKRQMDSVKGNETNAKLNNYIQKTRNPVRSGTGKQSLSFTIGIPIFLTKTDNDLSLRKLPNHNFEYNMLNAVKRYENSLERAGKAMIASERMIKEDIDNWYKLLETQNKTRKKVAINTQEYLKQQINDKVMYNATHRGLKL